jgi:hypothetical protein
MIRSMILSASRRAMAPIRAAHSAWDPTDMSRLGRAAHQRIASATASGA